MLSIFTVSLLSVLKIFLVCIAGTILAHRGIINRDFRQRLSQLILHLLLPCLLISKLSVSANLQNLRQWGVLPFVALVYIAMGMLLGKLAILICRPPENQKRLITAAMGFGNSGYVPYPLIMTIAATAPLFQNMPDAANLGIAYISVYLISMSPCLWGIGYPYLANKPFGHLRLSQLISPPVISVLCGITIGVVTPLRQLMVGTEAPLGIFLSTADLIGQAAIPSALLILGANLADARNKTKTVAKKTLCAIGAGRLIVMPLLGCALTVVLYRTGLIPRNPMCALVLMVEAAVPPATNLVVMCQLHGKGEGAMSKMLIWSYIAAIPTLTLFVAFFLWLAGNL